MRKRVIELKMIRLGVIFLILFGLAGCGEPATPNHEAPPPVSGVNSSPGKPGPTTSSPPANQTATPANGGSPSEVELATATPQSSAIQMAADPTSLKVGESATITGTAGQLQILDYTLFLDGNEFAKGSSTAQQVGTDPKMVLKFISASRSGNGVVFKLKANRPGKVTASLRGSGEATTSSGVRAYFTTDSNSIELMVVS